ncbi:MAG: hypothetical protein PHO02_02140 [Candidatus Nanoarchaeia archaeon]|nr:hypothetical protein [Candidatus Nanoarchaeia archaeon]
MIYRKGSTDTLSFLIGVIIFILIVVPIAIAITHYCSAQKGMEKTLRLLVERTSELEDGQKGSIVGYIEKGHIMLGFEKDKSYFGSGPGDNYWSCDTGTSDYGKRDMFWDIRKPAKCGKRACLCACPITEGKVMGLDVTPGDYLLADACEESSAVCEIYDENENPRFYGGADCEYGPFITHSIATIEINFEKQGQTVGICEEPPCISNDVNTARDIFKRFNEAYAECDNYEVNDCICSAVNGEALPSDHYIIFKNDGAKTEMKLQDTDGPTRASATIENTLMANYKAEKEEANLITDISIGQLGYLFNPPLGYNYAFLLEGTQLLYRTKEGYVGFVEEGEGIKAVRADKEYCRIKAGQIQTAAEETNQKCIADEMEGKCNSECEENTFAMGRKGQYCPTLTCCITEPDIKCKLQKGSCSPSCEPSSQTEIAGENLCPADTPVCCKSGSPCENLAGGECKPNCDERLNEEEASGSLFTSPACGGGYKCCVQTPIPLGA